jgi:uncharacterized protein
VRYGNVDPAPFDGPVLHEYGGQALSRCLDCADADRRGTDIKPSISVLTLAVADLEQSLVFYRDGLGLPSDGIIGREFEHGAVAFFNLSGGLKLGLWAQDDLAHDSRLPKHPISSTAVSIGHNVMHRADVDYVMRKAEVAGANIIKAPQDTFYGGYAGYFTDPDGHLWEVVWNPQMLPAA